MQTASAIREAGGEAIVMAGDVTASDFPERLVKAADQKFGAIDILINNAGKQSTAGEYKSPIQSASHSACPGIIWQLKSLTGAGYTWDGMLHKITGKQWEAMLAVHCTAPLRIIQV